MEPEQIYQHLENLAEQLGISIRHEDLTESEFKATSGLCKVKGRYFYIMDTSKRVSERIGLLSQCLSGMDLDGIYVLPAIRKLLASVRSGAGYIM
ncbi:MAG: hypothetical protein HWN68_05485 [Desulfobacterales bacterium]|nr:hypothetical protein [Desulfobacterales bacterium]